MDYLDLVTLAAAYGKDAGESGYVGAADFNQDGTIDYEDLLILAVNYQV